MNKSHKKEIIENYTSNTQNHTSVLLMKNIGFSASHMVELRRLLNRNDDKCLVVKNSLAKRVITTIAAKDLQKFLRGQIITIFSNEPVSTIKVLGQFDAQDLLIGGTIEGSSIDKKRISVISKFLLKDEVRHRISSSFKRIPMKILDAQRQVPMKIIQTIKNRFIKN